MRSLDAENDQPQASERVREPQRKAIPLPIRLATGEVIYRGHEANEKSSQAQETLGPDASSTRTYASKEAYFKDEEAVRARIAHLFPMVMGNPTSKTLVVELTEFIADFDKYSETFSAELQRAFNISLDILLKDSSGHGPLAALSRLRREQTQKKQEGLVNLALNGNGNAKDQIFELIRDDSTGYVVNNMLVAFRKQLVRRKYSVRHLFVFTLFNSLELTEGITNLTPYSGRGISYFQKRANKEVQSIKRDKTLTKRQRALALEMKQYDRELKQEALKTKMADLVAVHSSALNELFVIYTNILRKEYRHCVYALEKVIIGCDRYSRYLSVMYVQDLSAVLRNMLLSSIVSLPEVILETRMRLIDSMNGDDLSLRLVVQNPLSSVLKEESQKVEKRVMEKQRSHSAMVSQRIRKTFLLRDEFGEIYKLFEQKHLAQDVYATNGFILPVSAGLAAAMVVGKLQASLKEMNNDLPEIDLIIPIFYLLLHSFDVNTVEATRNLVRGIFYCLQAGTQVDARACAVIKCMNCLELMAETSEARQIITAFSQSVRKRFVTMNLEESESDTF
ncbi:hypothetical protein GMRT_15190 [Giardia muris]|uniref:Uncharacterized protein n=1 Tax=Giardia muris TaxID=5742 RepID=A0A4Z1SQL8_GIAMU|nr:hypothetical protein GMRT_15190 [Giardia muris]|eukprot:TNJ28126.1 hypothetical protein GMRT_15190 [Giardia muris]